MSHNKVRACITAGAVLLAIIHAIWPDLKIDAVTLVLLGMAVVPWLAPLFKSLELPGGWKVEFQELKDVTDRAGKAGLVADESTVAAENEFPFQLLASTDPNLALAGLRIEIEKRLVRLGKSNGLPVQRRGIGSLLRDLNQHELINGVERSVLSDLSGILNSAVHGATVEQAALNWAMEVGPRILRALDDRINSQSVRYDGIVNSGPGSPS